MEPEDFNTGQEGGANTFFPPKFYGETDKQDKELIVKYPRTFQIPYGYQVHPIFEQIRLNDEFALNQEIKKATNLEIKLFQGINLNGVLALYNNHEQAINDFKEQIFGGNINLPTDELKNPTQSNRNYIESKIRFIKADIQFKKELNKIWAQPKLLYHKFYMIKDLILKSPDVYVNFLHPPLIKYLTYDEVLDIQSKRPVIDDAIFNAYKDALKKYEEAEKTIKKFETKYPSIIKYQKEHDNWETRQRIPKPVVLPITQAYLNSVATGTPLAKTRDIAKNLIQIREWERIQNEPEPAKPVRYDLIIANDDEYIVDEAEYKDAKIIVNGGLPKKSSEFIDWEFKMEIFKRPNKLVNPSDFDKQFETYLIAFNESRLSKPVEPTTVDQYADYFIELNNLQQQLDAEKTNIEQYLNNLKTGNLGFNIQEFYYIENYYFEYDAKATKLPLINSKANASDYPYSKFERNTIIQKYEQLTDKFIEISREIANLNKPKSVEEYLQSKEGYELELYSIPKVYEEVESTINNYTIFRAIKDSIDDLLTEMNVNLDWNNSVDIATKIIKLTPFNLSERIKRKIITYINNPPKNPHPFSESSSSSSYTNISGEYKGLPKPDNDRISEQQWKRAIGFAMSNKDNRAEAERLVRGALNGAIDDEEELKEQFKRIFNFVKNLKKTKKNKGKKTGGNQTGGLTTAERIAQAKMNQTKLDPNILNASMDVQNTNPPEQQPKKQRQQKQVESNFTERPRTENTQSKQNLIKQVSSVELQKFQNIFENFLSPGISSNVQTGGGTPKKEYQILPTAINDITPLQFAVGYGSALSVAELVRNNAKFDVQTKNGVQTEYFANVRADDKFKQDVKTLLEKVRKAYADGYRDAGYTEMNTSYAANEGPNLQTLRYIYEKSFKSKKEGKPVDEVLSQEEEQARKEGLKDGEQGNPENEKYTKSVNVNIQKQYKLGYLMAEARISGIKTGSMPDALEKDTINEKYFDIQPAGKSPLPLEVRNEYFLNYELTKNKAFYQGFQDGVSGRPQNPNLSTNTKFGLSPSFSSAIQLTFSSPLVIQRYNAGFDLGNNILEKEYSYSLDTAAKRDGYQDGLNGIKYGTKYTLKDVQFPFAPPIIVPTTTTNPLDTIFSNKMTQKQFEEKNKNALKKDIIIDYKNLSKGRGFPVSQIRQTYETEYTRGFRDALSKRGGKRITYKNNKTLHGTKRAVRF